MLGNDMNIPTVMSMFLKASNFFNTSTNIGTECALSFIYDNNRTIRQIIPKVRSFPFNPFRIELIDLKLRDAVVIDSTWRQAWIIGIFVKT
ncbi:hypothetical protein ALO43_200202 [Pseudomonas tremae]|uniref:Uncharacterized protein n=1 Tax=Pseudomonas tremae TaxID=200454 RepID=A0AA40TW18_9PSED|nr:hypothetical protein ALO43_200202 [Pseudomonas tremae]